MITLTHDDLIALTMQRIVNDVADLLPLRDALWERLGQLNWSPNPHAHRAHGRPGRDDGDRALLQAFVHGSADAFDLLVARHGSALLAYAERSLSSAEAQDAVQDAYLALFRKARSVLAKPEQSVRAFLFGATRLRLLDALRRRVRAVSALESYAHQPPTGEQDLDPLAQILAKESRRQLTEAIERGCNPLEQDVIVSVLRGQANTEIARALDLDPSHVGVLKHRARGKIEQALAGRGKP